MIGDRHSAGWPLVRIRDIGRLHGGGTPSRKRPEFFQGTIPWITGQDIPETHVAEISAARDYVTDEAVQESATRVVPAGAVLVTTRVSVGKTAVAGCPICFSQDVTAILIHAPAIALPAYVAHFLRSRRESLLQKNQGSTIAGITRDSLALEQIPLPPLSEQQQIVEILEETQEIRRLRAEAEAKTAELIPAIYHEMFLASERRRRWKRTTVLDIAANHENAIRTGPFGSDLLHSEFVESGIPVLGIDNAVANRFRWGERRYIAPEKFSGLQRFRVFPGDVMVTIMGTVGRVAIAPADLPESISTKHLCVITCDTKQVLPNFLWGTLLYDPSVRAQTRAVAKGAIMEGWNSKIIRALKLPLPPLDLQERFHAHVEEVLTLEEPADGAALAEALPMSLSAHAFSGALTAEWREAHKDQLVFETHDRDAALQETGTLLTRIRRDTLREMEEILEDRTDGSYSELNREQRQLLREINRMVGDVHYVRYFSAQQLGEYLADGPLRRNPQLIEGHLAVLAARGLIISVSCEEQTQDTGEFVFGNAYRLPMKAYEPTEAEERDSVFGDASRLRELGRLAGQLEKERTLT